MKNFLLGLMAVLLLFLSQTSHSQSIPSYVPQNGLVGWWPFNGNAIDESGNGNNGTVNGATLAADRFGNTSKAYSFDGVNDWISIANSVNFSLRNGHSISVWYNPNSNKESVILEKFNSTNGPGDGGPQLVLRNNQLIDFSIFHNNTGNFVYSNTQSIPQTWVHIVATWNGNMIKLYQNGKTIDSLSLGVILNPCTEPLTIGKRASLNDLYFLGKIDDIGIWNRALSEQEIKNIYNGNICFQNVSVTDTLFINSTITSFNPITYENTIKIYPNPTQGQLTIDFGNINTLSGYQMKVINPLGQQIFQSNIAQRISTISLSSFAAKGVYFIQLIDSKGTITENRKIVIQ